MLVHIDHELVHLVYAQPITLKIWQRIKNYWEIIGLKFSEFLFLYHAWLHNLRIQLRFISQPWYCPIVQRNEPEDYIQTPVYYIDLVWADGQERISKNENNDGYATFNL